MRLRAEVRVLTRWARRRSRSLIARSSAEGSQSSGTRSRRRSSAKTLASTLSVLQASGATSLTLRAWATFISKPASSSRSRTQTAPLIISTQPETSLPSSRTSLASPSSLAAISPSAAIAPPSLIAHQAARP
jgi:hypothetical protein